MNPKEQAEQIVNSMLEALYNNGTLSFKRILYPRAKDCAAIAVTNIIASNPHSNPLNTEVHSTMQYWMDVKTEISKL